MAHRRKSPKTKKSEIKNLENCANTKKILNPGNFVKFGHLSRKIPFKILKNRGILRVVKSLKAQFSIVKSQKHGFFNR